jgi:hypothetical protein
LHVIPVRGCVVGVVGPALKGLTSFRVVVLVSGTAWDGGPEWVRAPYAKTSGKDLGGVPE